MRVRKVRVEQMGQVSRWKHMGTGEQADIKKMNHKQISHIETQM